MRREGRLGPTASAMAAGRVGRAGDSYEHVAAGAPPPRASSPSRNTMRSATRGAAGEPMAASRGASPMRTRSTTPMRRRPGSDVKAAGNTGSSPAQTTPVPRCAPSPAKRTPTPTATATVARGASPMPAAQRRSPSPGAKKAMASELDASDSTGARRARPGPASLRTPTGRKSPLRRRSPQAPADSGAGPSSLTTQPDSLEAKPARVASMGLRSSASFSTPTSSDSKVRMGNENAARQVRPSQRPPPAARKPSPPRPRMQRPNSQQSLTRQFTAAQRGGSRVEEKSFGELSIPIGQDLSEALSQIHSKDAKATAASASEMGMSELSTPSFIVDAATTWVNDADAALSQAFALNAKDFAIAGKLKDPGSGATLPWDGEFATDKLPAPKGLPAEFGPATGSNDIDASVRTIEVPASSSQGEPAPEPTEPPPTPMDDIDHHFVTDHHGVTDEDRAHASAQFKELFGALDALDSEDVVTSTPRVEEAAPDLSPQPSQFPVAPPAVIPLEVTVPSDLSSPPTLCCPPSARTHHILTQSDPVILGIGRQESGGSSEHQSLLGDMHYRLQLPMPAEPTSDRGTGAILKAAASLRREAQELGKAIEVWAELNGEPGGSQRLPEPSPGASLSVSVTSASVAPGADVESSAGQQMDMKQLEAPEIAAELERLRSATPYATPPSGMYRSSMGSTAGSASTAPPAPPANFPENVFVPPASCTTVVDYATAMDASGGDHAPAMPSSSVLYHPSGLPLLAQAPAQAPLPQTAAEMQPCLAAACAGLASDYAALQAWPTHNLANARSLAMQQMLAGSPALNPQLLSGAGGCGWLPLGLGAGGATSSTLASGSARQALDVRLQSPDLGAAFGTQAGASSALASSSAPDQPDQEPSPPSLWQAAWRGPGVNIDGKPQPASTLCYPSAALLPQAGTSPAMAALLAGPSGMTMGLASSSTAPLNQRPVRTYGPAAGPPLGCEAPDVQTAQDASLSPPPCRPLPRDWRGCTDFSAGFGDMALFVGKRDAGVLAHGSFPPELQDQQFQFHASSEGKPLADSVVTKERRLDWESHFASRGFGASAAAATAVASTAAAATGPVSSDQFSALGASAILGHWGAPGLGASQPVMPQAPTTPPPTSLQPPWS